MGTRDEKFHEMAYYQPCVLSVPGEIASVMVMPSPDYRLAPKPQSAQLTRSLMNSSRK